MADFEDDFPAAAPGAGASVCTGGATAAAKCCGGTAAPQGGGANGNGRNMVMIGIAFLATVGLLFVINSYLASLKPAETPIKPRPVKTMIITPADGDLVLRYPGRTRAARQVNVGFKVSGSLVDLPVNAGEVVKKGQVIARLDPRDIQNTLDARTADYMNAKARLERVQKLYDAAIDPKSKLDEAAAMYKVALANLEIAKKAREDCTLTASFDGIVAKRYVDNYQSVMQGAAIISLQDLSSLEVEVDFPEWLVAKANQIGSGSKAYAEYDSLPGKQIPLEIREFSAEADTQTRTFLVRFSMSENPDPAHVNILPGMTATVTVILKQTGNGEPEFVLPVWAVNSNYAKNQPYSFVVDTQVTPWVVRKRLVEAGALSGDSILVKSGLKTGERVVIAGADRLEDGMQVADMPAFMRPRPDSEDAPAAAGDKAGSGEAAGGSE